MVIKYTLGIQLLNTHLLIVIELYARSRGGNIQGRMEHNCTRILGAILLVL